MSEERVTTREVMLQHIERDWKTLQAFIAQLTPNQLTEIRNADGWALKDHIAHLSAWEQSVIAFLTGTPRHEGLGVPEAVYLSEDLNQINAAIFTTHRDDPLDDVLARFKAAHTKLWSLLIPLDDTALSLPYIHYLPDEPGEDREPPAINIIYGNTAHHFRTHQAWMEAILSDTSPSS